VLSCARQLFYLMQNTDCKVTNRLLLYAHVLKYLNWYFKSFDSLLTKEEFTQWEYEQFNHVRNYLVSDLTNPPTIEWLAKQVGINQSKLKKGFKQVFGKSIYAYFLTERMNKAKQLLMENSVTETAVMMGYSNISHFSSAFRKQFGVLPKEIRRQNSNFLNE
ncbi:helix-turn-helix domain-containing protein, partial [Gilliamella apicola]